MPSPPILAVQVGNTRVQLGLFDDDRLDQSFRFPNTDVAAIVAEMDPGKARALTAELARTGGAAAAP